ncbi:hypothetical protein CRUP_001677, partial [Coryphaenoides rupestris]
MKHLQFMLVLAIAVNVWECGDANKFGGERGGELLSPRRRRCYDGSAPRRLKKRDRKLLSVVDGGGTGGTGGGTGGGSGGEVCSRLYPRISCCPTRRAAYQILHRRDDARIFSTNNTDALAARPTPQVLFHPPDAEAKVPHREPELPSLCQDFCREFYYTCRGHIPAFPGRRGRVLPVLRPEGRQHLLPRLPAEAAATRGQESNYLGDERREDASRKHKHNCYCAQEVLSGLRQPVAVVHCGDGSQRLFVLEREGIVRILTPDLEGGDERGLLSLAFHPNYKKNGKLYVSYTTNQERWAIGPHDHILRVVEYTVSRKTPNQVDTRTVRALMEVAELHRKNLGGQLLDFTGSVLRVDVDTDSCASSYSIPRDNPYFNSTNQPPEIFAHGLHDPGRCAVDRLQSDNGSLVILCTDASGKNSSSGRILEIAKGKDYEHEPSVYDLQASGGAVPVGGFIYRGCQSRRLYGSYVFGDKSGSGGGAAGGGAAGGEQWQEKPLCLGPVGSCGSTLVGHILGFGEDEL